MREPVRLLSVLVILLGGLFGLKAISVVNGTTDWFAAQAAEASEDPPQSDDAGDTQDNAEPVDVNAVAPLIEEDGEAQCEPVASSVEFSARLAAMGVSETETRVLRALRDRREELDAREQAIETDENMLVAMEQRVDGKIAELRDLEDQIRNLVGVLSEREEQDLQELVAWFGQMEPDGAAERLTVLPMATQIRVASSMQPRTIGPILGEMDVEAAADLMQMMAVRSDLPETAEELEARLEDVR